MTGQPDFATLELEYVPDRLCVELKSLKLYIWSFRDRGAFHEAVTNEIVDRLAGATSPRFMRLTARFNVRGGDLYDRRGRAPTVRMDARRAGDPALSPNLYKGLEPGLGMATELAPPGAGRRTDYPDSGGIFSPVYMRKSAGIIPRPSQARLLLRSD